jgi:hypothetical protein
MSGWRGFATWLEARLCHRREACPAARLVVPSSRNCTPPSRIAARNSTCSSGASPTFKANSTESKPRGRRRACSSYSLTHAETGACSRRRRTAGRCPGCAPARPLCAGRSDVARRARGSAKYDPVARDVVTHHHVAATGADQTNTQGCHEHRSRRARAAVRGADCRRGGRRSANRDHGIGEESPASRARVMLSLRARRLDAGGPEVGRLHPCVGCGANCFMNASCRCFISAGVRSSLCVAIVQVNPWGSVNVPERSPQN